MRVQSSGSYFDVLSILANGEKSLLEKITAKINEEGRGVIVFINNVSTTENTLRKTSASLLIIKRIQRSKVLRILKIME